MSALDLSNIERQFHDVSARVQGLTQRLGPELIATRPRADAWSAAHCLLHLQITTNAYMPIWKEACRRPELQGRRAATAPFKLDLWGRFFIWFLDPPPKVRFAAPGRFEPSNDPAQLQTAPQLFLRSQDDILRLIGNAKDLPLDRIVIRDAFSKYVRHNLWSSLCANAAHHRRHVWQAERVAATLGRQLP